MESPLTRLFPQPGDTRPLRGLYLSHDLRGRANTDQPYIYSNCVVSLDGRIAVADANGSSGPPRSIAHDNDWRLYLELAAQADAVLTSGRRLRELLRENKSTLECVSQTNDLIE